MTVLQWADGHDNEAGYVSILLNKAGQSLAIAPGITYETYVTAADGTVKAKGAGSMRIIMTDVSLANYITMRETDLGYSADPDDISRNITITVPTPGLATTGNYNAICVHRPNVDAQLSPDGTRYQTVSWLIKIVSAT